MKKKHHKDDILQQGEQLFRKQGYNHTGINEILKVSGIPKGSFYNFFDSKEDFALKVVQRYGDKMYAFIDGQLSQPEKSALQRLKDLYQTVYHANKEEEFRQGCMVNTLMGEIAGQEDKLAEEADKAFHRWVERIEICVKEAQDDGSVRRDYTAYEIADYLHSSHYGIQNRGKASRDDEQYRRWFQMTFDFITT